MTSETDQLLDRDRAELLLRACRTTVGDQLRSITYFTDDGFTRVYLRSDLERDADLARFVEYEARGLDAHAAYRGSELGEYRFTIRVFDAGFLVRVTTPDEGVFLTTDGLTLQDFREVVTAVRRILEG